MVQKLTSKLTLKAHVIFVTVATVFGVFFVFAVPPFWGLDESPHFARVYQITHGEMNLSRSPDAYFGYLPENLQQLIDYSRKDLENNTTQAYGRKDVDSIDGYRKLTSQKFSSYNNIPAYQVANYLPIAYVGPIIGYQLSSSLDFNIGQTLTMARIFSLITYISLVGLAIYILKAHKLKWFIVVAGLLPTALFNGSMVSADTMLISLSFLLFAMFMKIIANSGKQTDRRLFFAFLCVGAIIPLIKVNYMLLSLGLLLALPIKNLFHRYGNTIKVAALLLIIAPASIWYLVSSGLGDPPSDSNLLPGGVSASSQMSFVLHHPQGFLSAILRSIQLLSDSYVATGSTIVGWNYISVPTTISVIMCTIAFIVLIIGMKEFVYERRRLIIPVLFSLAGILSVFLALYLAHSTVALPYVNGVQGRYLIPFLLPIAAFMGTYLTIEINQKQHERVIITALATLLIVLGWTALIFYAYTY